MADYDPCYPLGHKRPTTHRIITKAELVRAFQQAVQGLKLSAQLAKELGIVSEACRLPASIKIPAY